MKETIAETGIRYGEWRAKVGELYATTLKNAKIAVFGQLSPPSRLSDVNILSLTDIKSHTPGHGYKVEKEFYTWLLLTFFYQTRILSILMFLMASV